MNVKRLVWIVGAAIFILVTNVILSILYMVVYGYLINPGQSETVYQEHVEIAAPYCSIIFGIPLFYLVCRWIGGKGERNLAVKSALGVWLVYCLIDLSVILANFSQLTLWVSGLVIVSLITKLMAAYGGGLSASKRGSV